MKVGEIRPVGGGYGLMRVVEVDEAKRAAKMQGHGPASPHGHWFFFDRIHDAVGDDVILHERHQARARRVDCNNPDCWCRRVVG